MTRISTRLPLRTALTRSESAPACRALAMRLLMAPPGTAVGKQTEIGLRGLQMQGTALLLAEGFGPRLHFRQQALHREGSHHLVVAIAGKQQDVVDLLLGSCRRAINFAGTGCGIQA